jgi:hypothetical protein
MERINALVDSFRIRRILRAREREDERAIREARRSLQVGKTTCDECGRSFAVIPAEFFLPGSPAGEPPRGSWVDEGATTKYDGTFNCECGAMGWMRGACILAPREPGPPNVTQRRILESLAGGSQIDSQLIDWDDLPFVGELVLALSRGWVIGRLAGFGGILCPAPTIYELTPNGREALTRS